MNCHFFAYLNLLWVGIYIAYLVYSSKIISKYNNSYNSKYIQKYLENWNSKPITNISLVGNETQCNEIIGYFPGTNTFCDCKGSLSEGFCKNTDTNKCHTIFFFPDQLEVKKWNNKYFCITRLDKSYKELRKKYLRKSCDDSNEKDCGYFDFSHKNKLCLPNGENCPIHGFIKNDTENFDIEIIEDEEYPILTNIILSSEKLPCSHSYEGLFGQSKFKYNKLKGNNKCKTEVIKGFKYDERYKNIDNCTLKELGANNSFYKDYIDKSEILIKTYYENVSLSYTGYFEMTDKAFKKFKENGDIIKIKMSNALMIIVIVITSIFLLINAGFCTYAVLSCLEVCDIREQHLSETLLIEIVLKYFGSLSNGILLLIINIQYFIKRKNIKNTIKDSFNHDYTIYAYDLAVDNFYKVKTLIFIFDILFGVEIVSMIFGNLIYFYCPSILGNAY